MAVDSGDLTVADTIGIILGGIIGVAVVAALVAIAYIINRKMKQGSADANGVCIRPEERRFSAPALPCQLASAHIYEYIIDDTIHPPPDGSFGNDTSDRNTSFENSHDGKAMTLASRAQKVDVVITSPTAPEVNSSGALLGQDYFVLEQAAGEETEMEVMHEVVAGTHEMTAETHDVTAETLDVTADTHDVTAETHDVTADTCDVTADTRDVMTSPGGHQYFTLEAERP
ncbi:PREDICTED: uncharacterized protein LOC106814323 [Priapulus caudatus]|uniref:Uncharacterized protein LOC106814323 n=1 Tax=Priapulus caudatus TaxID=37621 RepID=A0ABM1EPI8_PRICU|nr:PREDICTED: uncharacterized protein LOC106814323 [Priapulus caudatus]